MRSFMAAVLMMVVFFHAARLAMVVFDPFLSSRPLAEALLKSPEGRLILDHNLWALSSITFYVERDALILNGRYFNMEYGSYAPRAPGIFIDDTRFKRLWLDSQRCYLVTFQPKLQQFKDMIGPEHLEIVAAGGGKLILTNHPLERTGQVEGMLRLSAAYKNTLAKPWVYR
jgi:hypothetical protein